MTTRSYRELPPALQAKVAAAFLDASRDPRELAQQFGVDLAQVEAWKNDLATFVKGGRVFASAAASRPEEQGGRPGGAAPVQRQAPKMRPLPKLPTEPVVELAADEEATRLSDFPTLWEAPPARPPAAPQAAPPAAAAPPPASGPAPVARHVLDVPPAPPAPAVAPPAPMAASAGVLPPRAAPAQPAAPRPPQVAPASVPAGIDGPAPAGLFARFFVGRKERKAAAVTAREMLEIHRKISGAYPALKGNLLYRQVVVAYKGGGLPEADSVLRRAADSYARWPVERPLAFRDVVHYVAVTDYLATNVSANWTQENIGRQVARLVRDGL